MNLMTSLPEIQHRVRHCSGIFGIVLAFNAFGFIHTGAQEARTIQIGVIPGALRYDISRFEVYAGENLEVVFGNNGLMQHNWLLARPGAVDTVVHEAMALGSDGFARQFIPESPQVLRSIPLVEPGQSIALKFSAPSEMGEYPYVCTFPGHGIIMRGVMVVKPVGGGLAAPVRQKADQTEIRNNLAHVTYTNKPEGSPSRPFVIRTFMPDPGLGDEVFPHHGKGQVAQRYSPDTGGDVPGTVPPIPGIPAAVGVNFGHTFSLCFDTTECRLLYTWHQGFLDMEAYWGRGPGGGRKSFDYVPRLIGNILFSASGRHPIQINNQWPKPRFKRISYRDNIPVFTYQCGQSSISESYSILNESQFVLDYQFDTSADESLTLSLPRDLADQVYSLNGEVVDRFAATLQVPPASSVQARFVIHIKK